MPLSATRQMESISIQISDAAFERMKNDPDYEAWVLNDLREALSQSNPRVPVSGGGYSVFYIGATKEECHAEGWYPGYMGGQGAATGIFFPSVMPMIAAVFAMIPSGRLLYAV